MNSRMIQSEKSISTVCKKCMQTLIRSLLLVHVHQVIKKPQHFNLIHRIVTCGLLQIQTLWDNTVTKIMMRKGLTCTAQKSTASCGSQKGMAGEESLLTSALSCDSEQQLLQHQRQSCGSCTHTHHQCFRVWHMKKEKLLLMKVVFCGSVTMLPTEWWRSHNLKLNLSRGEMGLWSQAQLIKRRGVSSYATVAKVAHSRDYFNSLWQYFSCLQILITSFGIGMLECCFIYTLSAKRQYPSVFMSGYL